MTKEILATEIFLKNWNALNDPNIKYIVNIGGSRSSKSFSIMQCLITLAMSNKKVISIVRQSMPSLRATAMRDFMNLIQEYGIYNEESHQKTENYYKFENGSMVEFFSTDSEMKLRGRKRDYLYVNEANEITFEIFNQLALRTSEKIFFDLNPSESESWVYDLAKQPNAIIIKSTYKDNRFLSESQIEYIENLINVDESYYRIYCLGEPPIANTRIFTHFKQFIDYPDPSNIKDKFYGADWGYNHPTALIEVLLTKDDKYYITEKIFKDKLTSNDIVKEFYECVPDKSRWIYADYARPEIIEELRRNGFNMKEADKSVKAGIDYVKTKQIFIHHESINLLREHRLYSWKSNGDVILDEPIKLNDDLCDSLRYALFTSRKKSPNLDYYKFY